MVYKNMRSAGAVEKVLLIISIIGAINWGLVGLFNFNLVDAIFGGGAQEQTSAASREVYAIVGIAGFIALFLLPVLRARTTSDRGYVVHEARSH